MDGSFSLMAKDRQALTRQKRAGMASLWVDVSLLQALLGVSSRTIAAMKQCWNAKGISGLDTAQPERTKLLAA